MTNNLQQGLASPDPALRLAAVKSLKNQVIGSRLKKLQHLHLLPQLLAALPAGDEALQVQLLAAVGSMAYGVDEGVRAIAAAGGIGALLAALGSSRPRVVEAAARALKLVYQSPLAPHGPLLQPDALCRLVALVAQRQPAQPPSVAEAAALTLARCCGSPDEAQLVSAAGAVPALLQLLGSSRRSSQEAALEALAALTEHSLQACQQLLQQPSDNSTEARQPQGKQQHTGKLQQQQQQNTGDQQQQQQQQQQQDQQKEEVACVLDQLLQLMKQRDSRLRFSCARCVAHLSRAAAASHGAAAELQPKLAQACRSVLPHLVRLLSAAEAASSSELHLASSHRHGSSLFGGGSSSRGGSALPSSSSGGGDGALGGEAGGDCRYLLQVPAVLAQLIHERPELLKLAMDQDCIKLLIKLLSSKAASPSPAAAAAASSQRPLAAAAAAVAPSSAVAAARAAAAAAAAAEAAAGAVALRRGCLAALGCLAAGGGDAGRAAMMDEEVDELLVAALADDDAGVRAAAAGCLRGLCRSVRLLRGEAIPDEVVPLLLGLLGDSGATEVQVAAAGAVSNLLLPFSSLRPALLAAGVLPLLAGAAGSMDAELATTATWALKDLAHEAGRDTQASLLAALGWSGLRGLLAGAGDGDGRVAEQAVALLQNLTTGGDSLQQLLEWSDGELLPLLEQQLDPAIYQQLPAAAAAATPIAVAGSSSSGSSSAAPLQQLKARLVGLLYTTANIASGYESHKAALMATAIPRLLLRHLTAGNGGGSSSDAAVAFAGEGSSAKAAAAATAALDVDAFLCDVQLAAVWCVINLLWKVEGTAAAAAGGAGASEAAAAAGGSGSGAGEPAAAAAAAGEARAARVAAFKALGLEAALRKILARASSRAAGPTAAAAAAPEQPAAAADADGGDGLGLPLPPLLDAGSQDLLERVTTALELLGV